MLKLPPLRSSLLLLSLLLLALISIYSLRREPSSPTSPPRPPESVALEAPRAPPSLPHVRWSSPTPTQGRPPDHLPQLHPLPPSSAESSKQTPQQAAATAIQRALLRFQFEGQPQLDGCVQQEAGVPLSPQPVRVRFQRPDAHSSFIATEVSPLHGGLLTPAQRRCLEVVLGRALEFPEEFVAGRSEFETVVSFLFSAAPP